MHAIVPTAHRCCAKSGLFAASIPAPYSPCATLSTQTRNHVSTLTRFRAPGVLARNLLRTFSSLRAFVFKRIMTKHSRSVESVRPVTRRCLQTCLRACKLEPLGPAVACRRLSCRHHRNEKEGGAAARGACNRVFVKARRSAAPT
jgi:hypothetical protein